MATVAEIIAALRESNGDEPNPAIEELATAYESDISVREAKIADVTSEKESLAAKLDEQKVANYDLLKSLPGVEVAPEVDTDNSVETDENYNPFFGE